MTMDLSKDAASAGVSGPIEAWLQELWDRGGSDLLLSEGIKPMIRVDGGLIPIEAADVLTAERVEELVLGLLPEDKRAELVRHREVDFSFGWHDVTRLRGNAFYQRGTVAVALRVIPFYIPSFDELGLPPVFNHLCGATQGLVLVTGPTGSGKSTTQASMVDKINATRPVHILTLEDPIEFVHRHKKGVVSQREIGFDTTSFPRGLRAALREDPDVLLVGEMRDPESIQTTLSFAETGHLVIATLHTNDASTAIDRIIDVFPTDRQQQVRAQLAACLHAVIAQRLVPRIGGGLAAAFEVLVATTAGRSLIREGRSHQIRNVIAQGASDGMFTLEASLTHLVEQGYVSYEDAAARAVVPSEVRLRRQPPPPVAPMPAVAPMPPAAATPVG
ncbi:MAG TPA: type IV pilus twitching motility protein PilT [Iamia sp.]|nr:type IV pilus twitching motility protein PilT [Iamia sp.]